MSRAPLYPAGAWPRLLQAPMAAAYCGEESVDAFRRKVGLIYPAPVVTEGSRQRWLRDDLDAAILALAGRIHVEPAGTASGPTTSSGFDAASVL